MDPVLKMEERREEFDVSRLLSSLKKVVETNDKNRVDLLKNGLTKILFRNAISFEEIIEIREDLEDIFRTAESFVVSLLSEETAEANSDIILEAPEEFRNEAPKETQDARTGTTDVTVFEPERSTHREADNDRPEVPLLSEEIPCENSTQTFSKSERENTDIIEDKTPLYSYFNATLISEDSDQTNYSDKIKFRTDSGGHTSIVNTKVGVVVKPEFSIHSRPCVSILNTTNVTLVTGAIRQNNTLNCPTSASDFNSGDLNEVSVKINEKMPNDNNRHLYELPPELPLYLRKLTNEDTEEDDKVLNVKDFKRSKPVIKTLPPPLVSEETDLILPDFLLKSSNHEEFNNRRRNASTSLPQLPDKSILDLISLKISALQDEEQAQLNLKTVMKSSKTLSSNQNAFFKNTGSLTKDPKLYNPLEILESSTTIIKSTNNIDKIEKNEEDKKSNITVLHSSSLGEQENSNNALRIEPHENTEIIDFCSSECSKSHNLLKKTADDIKFTKNMENPNTGFTPDYFNFEGASTNNKSNVSYSKSDFTENPKDGAQKLVSLSVEDDNAQEFAHIERIGYCSSRYEAELENNSNETSHGVNDAENSKYTEEAKYEPFTISSSLEEHINAIAANTSECTSTHLENTNNVNDDTTNSKANYSYFFKVTHNCNASEENFASIERRQNKDKENVDEKEDAHRLKMDHNNDFSFGGGLSENVFEFNTFYGQRFDNDLKMGENNLEDLVSNKIIINENKDQRDIFNENIININQHERITTGDDMLIIEETTGFTNLIQKNKGGKVDYKFEEGNIECGITLSCDNNINNNHCFENNTDNNVTNAEEISENFINNILENEKILDQNSEAIVQFEPNIPIHEARNDENTNFYFSQICEEIVEEKTKQTYKNLNEENPQSCINSIPQNSLNDSSVICVDHHNSIHTIHAVINESDNNIYDVESSYIFKYGQKLGKIIEESIEDEVDSSITVSNYNIGGATNSVKRSSNSAPQNPLKDSLTIYLDNHNILTIHNANNENNNNICDVDSSYSHALRNEQKLEKIAEESIVDEVDSSVICGAIPYEVAEDSYKDKTEEEILKQKMSNGTLLEITDKKVSDGNNKEITPSLPSGNIEEICNNKIEESKQGRYGTNNETMGLIILKDFKSKTEEEILKQKMSNRALFEITEIDIFNGSNKVISPLPDSNIEESCESKTEAYIPKQERRNVNGTFANIEGKEESVTSFMKCSSDISIKKGEDYKVIPIASNTQKIYDLPIIGNNNYLSSELEKSQTKLEELLSLPRISTKRNTKKAAKSLVANSAQILQTSSGHLEKVKAVDESAKVDHVTIHGINNVVENEEIAGRNEELFFSIDEQSDRSCSKTKDIFTATKQNIDEDELFMRNTKGKEESMKEYSDCDAAIRRLSLETRNSCGLTLDEMNNQISKEEIASHRDIVEIHNNLVSTKIEEIFGNRSDFDNTCRSFDWGDNEVINLETVQVDHVTTHGINNPVRNEETVGRNEEFFGLDKQSERTCSKTKEIFGATTQNVDKDELLMRNAQIKNDNTDCQILKNEEIFEPKREMSTNTRIPKFISIEAENNCGLTLNEKNNSVSNEEMGSTVATPSNIEDNNLVSTKIEEIFENRMDFDNTPQSFGSDVKAKDDNLGTVKILSNLDDTISQLNLDMQKSAEIDESLQSERLKPIEETSGDGNGGLQRVADGWEHVGAPRRAMFTSLDGRDACACQEASIVGPSPAGCAHANQCSRCPAASTTLADGLCRERVPKGSESIEEIGVGKGETEETLAGVAKSEENAVEEQETSIRKPRVELRTSNLTWAFRNGRLVFEDPEESDGPSVLKSKNVNPKSQEGGRLKILEEKLKEAGITDGKKEDTSGEIGNSSSSEEEEEEDFLPSDSEDITFCEFDSNDLQQINQRQPILLCYHELDDGDSFEDFEDGDEILIMRGDNAQTNNPDRKLHNPDRENLKSLLKKPGRSKEQPKKNRVVFNETKNEFFDADYIILIREECEYDDEEDDGVCTCNQHEMVRLTCCEPNCNCNVYDGYDTTPQSPKFAPPLEFVDAVTLSPPEEYKDMELEEQQLIALQQQMVRRGQRGAVCRECSASHEEEGEGSLSDNDDGIETPSDDQREIEEKDKTDQSQQTTPTTPPSDNGSNDEGQRYILETLTMTTVSERQIMKEADDKPQSPTPTPNVPPGGSPISGILKGGRLWKQASNEINTSGSNSSRTQDIQQSENVTSDDEGANKRSVRFIETKENPALKQRDVCDGAPDVSMQEEVKLESKQEESVCKEVNSQNSESTEMMLTFKLGNHVLISNNSLKPNSAVRQLFPCTKPLGKAEEDTANNQQYLVTAESLKAFEEAKRSKLPQIIQSGDTDESIRKAIERNTLRRSLIRGDPKNKKAVQKTDNSLVERIKQLTCDVDDDVNLNQEELQQQRASPPGEEARSSPEVNLNKMNNHDKSFSPSSSSTASSNSSSMSSTYKKITDLFSKRDKPDIQNVDSKLHLSAPDLGNGPQEFAQEPALKINTTESRKQFLSTLVPLTACVSGIGLNEDYYHINNGHNGGDRTSMASSVGTEYSLEDIDEVLRKDEEESKKIAPDVLAGTPSASESGDELAMFVQQDAGRIERIKKKYQPETTEEDDEHDDYGFNRRPSVRGIKPRFGSTTEILQQIQNQMQPPSSTPPRSQVVWPYYSETNLTSTADIKRNPPPPINQNHPPINQNHPPVNQNLPPINQNIPPYPPSYQPNANQTNEEKRAYIQYSRPTNYIEENLYQNCTNQRCTQINYRNMNLVYPSVVRVGGGCSEYYNSTIPRRNSRPLSPPPQEVSKNYHQTMVYIPYNHLEGYHNYYTGVKDCYTRVSNQNQINKRYMEAYRVEDQYSKPVLRQQVYASESPQFSTARSTQTPSMPNCYMYPNPTTPNLPPPTNRYNRSMMPPPNGVLQVWGNNQDGGVYPKINRHSYPRYPPSDSLSLTDSDSQHSKNSMPNSPTKSSRFIERGVPEGAASVSPQDGQMQNNSTMTSPTSPQNPQGPKPMFYAMNV